MVRPHHLVVALRDIHPEDVHYVGGQFPTSREGFVVTTQSYFKFLKENSLELKIAHLINSINFERAESLEQVTKHVKNLIEKSKIPDSIVYKVVGHYVDLNHTKVRVEMNILSGDHRQNKIGQTVNSEVEGDAVLLDTIRSMWASLFTPHLITFRHLNYLDHLKTGVAVVVQKN